MTPWVVGLYIVLICSILIVLTIIVIVLSIGGIVLMIIIMVGIVCGIIVIDLIVVVIVLRACGAWCGCVAWGSVVSIIIIIVVVIVSIIIIISCIVGVMDGAVLCRWMHRGGGCWFFRGYSRHPRVGFFYYRGGECRYVQVAEVLE